LTHRWLGRERTDLPSQTEEHTMGLFSAIGKSVLAKKVIDEARKPGNQAKITSALASMRDKRGPGGTGRR
jgi:hypothetical protein